MTNKKPTGGQALAQQKMQELHHVICDLWEAACAQMQYSEPEHYLAVAAAFDSGNLELIARAETKGVTSIQFFTVDKRTGGEEFVFEFVPMKPAEQTAH